MAGGTSDRIHSQPVFSACASSGTVRRVPLGFDDRFKCGPESGIAHWPDHVKGSRKAGGTERGKMACDHHRKAGNQGD